MYIEVTMW